MSHENRSLFMELPTEIRENIFRYLFVASYTTVEHNMRSKEYNAKRSELLTGSDQIYHFHTSIMRTNRRIYEESVNLFRRENHFFCLTSSQASRLTRYLPPAGTQKVVSGAQAHQFSYAAVTLTVDPPVPSKLLYYGWNHLVYEYEQPCKYIFCLDEMPKFCRLLLKYLGKIRNGQPLRKRTIHIDIRNTLKEQSGEIDRSASGLLRLHKLLDPLRQLHSIGAVQISGPLSASYKSGLIADLCKGCPTAMEIIGTATVMVGQADEQLGQNHPIDAINIYKAALNSVRSCCWMYDERHFIMDSGPFPGLAARYAMRNVKVRLLARIASTYFQNGMLRMARIYVERVLNPQHFLDYDYHKMHELDHASWHYAVYAEVLHVSAQISYAQGHVWKAVSDFERIQRYVELDEEQQRTLELWKRHEDRLKERRAEKEKADENHAEKEGCNTEEKFHVICKWKTKGDQFLERGRCDLAISTYQAALSRIERLTQSLGWKIRSGTFESHTVGNSIRALHFKIQTSIATSHLQSGRFTEVIKCIDDLLIYDHDISKRGYFGRRNCKYFYESGDQDWLTDQRLDYAKAHHCNSIALIRIGETKRAVEQMEKAVKFDPENSAISAELMILKRKAEKEES